MVPVLFYFSTLYVHITAIIIEFSMIRYLYCTVNDVCISFEFNATGFNLFQFETSVFNFLTSKNRQCGHD
jgi:hypothetical protein